MRLKLEARTEAARWVAFVTPLLAAVLTLVSGIILFAALGYDPGRALNSFFIKPVENVYGLTELAVKATPLLLCALGLAVGFRGGVWNIGAEGQLTVGAIAAGGLALAFNGEEPGWLLPAMVVAGAAGGALWAAVPAFLRVRFNTNEILTSLMLSYVALQFLGYLVHGPWRDPQGFNFPQTRDFGAGATIPLLMEGTRLHIGTLLAALAVPAAWLLLDKSYLGFQIRVAGLAPGAAAYAGYPAGRIVWVGFIAGGAMAGLAGMMEAAGPIGKLQPVISPGYGFAAIIVAFLGRLNAVGILFASLLVALLYLGGETAQIDLKLPPAVTGVFQGLLLFFLLGSDFLARYRLKFERRAAA
ncbi:MAG TPA: ABC transporter permease [Alphaproteobacteria bacterium]|jgi:simple sugar transport system permease protein